jgi:hypothetical protein
MRRNFLKMIGLGGVAAALSGCGGQVYTWNQKLTVIVKTPQGERSGSGITTVTAKVGGQPILSQAMIGYSVRGEASVVDLGNGKYLFALLSNTGRNATEYWALNTFPNRILGTYPYTEEQLNLFYGALTKFRGKEPLAKENYPLLVTFRDVNDPKSVREVKPDKLSDAFGAGYALKSITLEITDEDVTDGEVQKIVPWIGDTKVMENPGWMELSITARTAIGGLLTDFKKAQNR